MKKLELFYEDSPTKLKTRYKILDAAIDLYLREGIAGITMVQISDEADIAIRNLYRYYPSKELLVVDAAYHIFESNEYERNIKIDNTDTGYRTLEKLLKELYMFGGDSVKRNNHIRFIMYFDIFISKVKRENPAFIRYTTLYVEAINDKVKLAIKDALLKGIEDNTISISKSEIDFYEEFIVQSIFSVLMRVIVKEYENEAINKSLIQKQIEIILRYIGK